MRDEAPVYRNDRHDFWALSRHADVEVAHRDPKTFSSSRGTVLEIMGPDLSRTGQMIFLDPPDHTHLRHLVSRAFTPRRTSQIERRVRDLCVDMLDQLRGQSEFDYLQDFGANLPPMVISSLLGLPEEDQVEVRHIIDRVFHIEPGVGMVNETSLNASGEVAAYVAKEIDKKREEPQDDLLSALVAAEIEEEDGTVRRMTPREVVEFAMLLYMAGTETVARFLGWAAVVLADNPDQRKELVSDFSLIPAAVEEILRLEAPSPVQGRWTTRDVELHDTVIPKDSKVLLLTAAAGRDERAYTNPDRFDIHRSGPPHVSFGYGIHFCLGAALARLEARVALEETFKRFPEWDVDHARAERLHTSTVRGYAKVPIRV
ncbi:MAG: cytochrome P450 [Acidimicrobiia bacterium]|nr:cytochrome P450 [Acidimicrobiia bacterium]